MTSLKQVLMDRDKLSPHEADEHIEEAREAMHEYLAENRMDLVEEVCAEFFGLEPDYLTELI